MTGNVIAHGLLMIAAAVATDLLSADTAWAEQGAAAYRVHAGTDASLEFLAGARVWWLHVQID